MRTKILIIVQFSILTAIEALFCFTFLGSLPAVGPMVATLMMIPVIITALLFGPKAGSVMGGVAGLFSFIVWTFMPPSPLAAFVFTPFYVLGDMKGNFGSLLICFIPRVLVGTVTGVTYTVLSKIMPGKNYLSQMISCAAGSMTNTLGVMGGIWLFFGRQYSSMANQSMLLIIGMTILTNGIPEAFVSAVIAPAVCKPIKIITGKKS